MRHLSIAVLALFLGVLPGCRLYGGMPGDRGPSPNYFAVSREVEPLWQGWRDDSIPHLRLRLWLLDAAEGASVRNTYDPAVKMLVLEGEPRGGLALGIELVDSRGHLGPRTSGLLIQRQDDQGRPGLEVDCLLFEGAHGISPAGGDHYCIFYGERWTRPVLWSEADGFRPIGLADLGGWDSIAVIPGEAIVARTDRGLVALDWAGNPMPDPGWAPGFDARAVYPVLDDTAILIKHRGNDGPHPTKEGAYMWRPGKSPHRVVPFQEGWVEGPGNAYFGFEHNRDRIYRLEWPADGEPTARRVLGVPGAFRTASSMSPDGRFVISGDPGFKVPRNDARVHEVHEDGTRLWRRVGDPGRGLRPVWLHKRFGAPGSVEVVRRP